MAEEREGEPFGFNPYQGIHSFSRADTMFEMAYIVPLVEF